MSFLSRAFGGSSSFSDVCTIIRRELWTRLRVMPHTCDGSHAIPVPLTVAVRKVDALAHHMRRLAGTVLKEDAERDETVKAIPSEDEREPPVRARL